MKVKRLYCILIWALYAVNIDAFAQPKAIPLQPSTFGGVVDGFGRFTNTFKVFNLLFYCFLMSLI